MMNNPKTTIAGTLLMAGAIFTLVAHALQGGPSLNDLTALLAALGGLGLVAAKDGEDGKVMKAIKRQFTIENAFTSVASALLTILALGGTLSGCTNLPNPANLIPVTGQHPAWAMNSADCATLGPAIALFVTSAPEPIAAAGTIAKAICDAESSLVTGQPAQVTQTTTTVQGTTKTP
jgi:hypothetical protein